MRRVILIFSAAALMLVAAVAIRGRR